MMFILLFENYLVSFCCNGTIRMEVRAGNRMDITVEIKSNKAAHVSHLFYLPAKDSILILLPSLPTAPDVHHRLIVAENKVPIIGTWDDQMGKEYQCFKPSRDSKKFFVLVPVGLLELHIGEVFSLFLETSMMNEASEADQAR